MEAREGVPAHEWDIFPGRRAYSQFDARDARGWDVAVLKWVELPRLLLPVGALDLEDTHQHRLRVAKDLVVAIIRVDQERLHIGQGGWTICPYLLRGIIANLAQYLQLLRAQSTLLEEVLFE